MQKVLSQYGIYILGILFLLTNCFLFVQKDFFLLLLLPIGLLTAFAILFELDKLFLFVAFCTPLSLNLEELSGGIGLYLPTEPILLIMMVVFGLKQIHAPVNRDYRIINHPISIAIYFHIAWIFMTTITSELPIVSLKYLISQLWFIIPCFFYSILIFKHKKSFINAFIWSYLLPLTLVLLFTLIKHALHGFSEESGHWIMSPFFKDHTSYGAIIALFFPIVASLAFNPKFDLASKGLIYVMLLIFTVALFYSYTRAAWLSVIAAGMIYLLFYFKIHIKYLLAIGAFGALFLLSNWTEISYGIMKNDAEHTTENISERFESMSNVSSDASNLERLNRWDCAFKMFFERPMVGYGPGTYADTYAPFQSPANLTIISTNSGQGGNAHSEYFGRLAEQGVFGLVSILWLLFAIFYTASKLYIRLEDKELKRTVMMLMLGLATYFIHGFLNNYLDTDKASVPIWTFTAIIVVIDVYYSNNDDLLEKSTTD
jgi:putative inorganic carbon (HCO3(-)) transporter